MVDIFTSDMQRVAGKAPPSFAAQVKDTQKRLNILFDHLNNHDLIKEDTIARLSQLALALQNKDYDTAAKMQVDVQREKLDECGNWMVSRLDFSNIDIIADELSTGWCQASHQHEQSDSLNCRGDWPLLNDAMQLMNLRRFSWKWAVDSSIKYICALKYDFV
jgi:protein transport protein SEC31